MHHRDDNFAIRWQCTRWESAVQSRTEAAIYFQVFTNIKCISFRFAGCWLSHCCPIDMCVSALTLYVSVRVCDKHVCMWCLSMQCSNTQCSRLFMLQYWTCTTTQFTTCHILITFGPTLLLVTFHPDSIGGKWKTEIAFFAFTLFFPSLNSNVWENSSVEC